MSFVPPFYNPYIDDAVNYRSAIEPARGEEEETQQEVDCSDPQEQLNMCCKSCDLFLTERMAKDCSVALTWTCVLSQQCPSCTSQISRTLDCYGVVDKCGFVQCEDLPLPPSLAGYYGQAQPDTATTNSMTPASSPTSSVEPTYTFDETLFPTVNPLKVNETASSSDSPLFAQESGANTMENVGRNLLVAVLTVWMVAFRS